MNYQLHYDRLISRARNRTLSGYSERHHVEPSCLGGADVPANVVYLTPEEHYVAHQLLVKLYPGNILIAHAAVMVSGQRRGVRPPGFKNKVFGWLRRRKAAAMTGVKRPEHAAKLRGRKHSPETIAKMKIAQLGRKRSAAAIAAMSAAALNRSPEVRANMAKAQLGKKLTPEHRALLSEIQKEVFKTPKRRASHKEGQKRRWSNWRIEQQK